MVKKWQSVASLLLFLGLSVTNVSVADSWRILNVQQSGQETDVWCWAASGQMIMRFLGKNVTQCTQAGNRNQVNNCCNAVTGCPTDNDPWGTGGCVYTGVPEFSKYGFATNQTANGTALSWNQLKAEIDNNRPITFGWYWVNGGGHMMIATGYYEYTTGEKFVYIIDPLPVCEGTAKWVTYGEYVSSPNEHNHAYDIYNIKRTQ